MRKSYRSSPAVSTPYSIRRPSWLRLIPPRRKKSWPADSLFESNTICSPGIEPGSDAGSMTGGSQSSSARIGMRQLIGYCRLSTVRVKYQ